MLADGVTISRVTRRRSSAGNFACSTLRRSPRTRAHEVPAAVLLSRTPRMLQVLTLLPTSMESGQSKQSAEKRNVMGRSFRRVPADVAILGWLLAFHGSAAADAAAGAKLASARCVSCHSSTETIHSMLPLLEGQPKEYFVAQWRAFRERKRTAPVMVGLAAELREEDVSDLAEHYAAQLPPRTSEPPGSDVGRALADRLRCGHCHGSGFEGTKAGAARLAGQRARYTAWSLQLMRSGSRSHGNDAKPDPLLASLSNAEIDALAAHFESLR